MQAERYNNNSVPFRYNVTSVITVTSTKVDLVRKMDSELGKIKRANQGQFSIEDRDANTPYIKRIRVVTTIDYSLED